MEATPVPFLGTYMGPYASYQQFSILYTHIDPFLRTMPLYDVYAVYTQKVAKWGLKNFFTHRFCAYIEVQECVRFNTFQQFPTLSASYNTITIVICSLAQYILLRITTPLYN